MWGTEASGGSTASRQAVAAAASKQPKPRRPDGRAMRLLAAMQCDPAVRYLLQHSGEGLQDVCAPCAGHRASPAVS